MLAATLGRLLAPVDLLLPERCAVCGRGETALCGACAAELRRIRAPLCLRCGAPTAWPVSRCAECSARRIGFASARGAVEYAGPARILVSAWKEQGRRRLADAAAAVVAECIPRPPVDALTYVPADRARALWRGHSTAQGLALALGRRWSLDVVPVLGRTGRAERQRGLSRAERRRNVRGAFRAALRAPPRTCLVDDVYTTGATASEAAAALRSAGARTVHVVTFARAVRR